MTIRYPTEIRSRVMMQRIKEKYILRTKEVLTLQMEINGEWITLCEDISNLYTNGLQFGDWESVHHYSLKSICYYNGMSYEIGFARMVYDTITQANFNPV